MITLFVIKIRVFDKDYIISRKELEEVRKLLCSINAKSDKERNDLLEALLKETYTFSNRRKYSLYMDVLKIDDVFCVWSERKKLTEKEAAHISKLISCAVNTPNSLLVFPDYIKITSDPPPPASPPPSTPIKPKKSRKNPNKDG